jgi:hypothetical protein
MAPSLRGKPHTRHDQPGATMDTNELFLFDLPIGTQLAPQRTLVQMVRDDDQSKRFILADAAEEAGEVEQLHVMGEIPAHYNAEWIGPTEGFLTANAEAFQDVLAAGGATLGQLSQARAVHQMRQGASADEAVRHALAVAEACVAMGARRRGTIDSLLRS